MPPQENWHLDKKVPISIIVALFMQTIVFVYVGTTWKSDVDARLTAIEKTDSEQSSHENRIVILEQNFNYIRGDLAEIKALLRRTIPESPNQ